MRTALRLLLLLLLAPACSTPWSLRSARSDRASVQEKRVPPVLPGDRIPLRCVFHVHSRYSHDSRGRIRDIAAAARANGVAAVFLTDHSNPRSFTDCPSGPVDGVWFVRGEEITVDGSLL